MVFYSHMYPKLMRKGLIIDIGDQAMLRGALKAGLEQVWSSFGPLLGVKLTPLGSREAQNGPAGIGTLTSDIPCIPGGTKEGCLQPWDGPKSGLEASN